jgi:multiple sugar transport system permease protein
MDDNAPHGRKSRVRASDVVTNVLTVAYFVFALFPVFWILLLSLKPDKQLFTTYFVFDPTLENYTAVLGLSQGAEGIPFVRFFFNSLVISFGAVAIALLVGVPAAYAAARWKFRGS